MLRKGVIRLAGLGLCLLPGAVGRGQALDPARDGSALRKSEARALPEQFIWTKGDAAALDPAYQARVRGQEDKIAPHYFRVKFRVDRVPSEATLYLAGPRTAHVFLNGTRVMEVVGDGSAKGFKVLHASVAGALQVGENVLAMEVVRGHSSLHTGASPTINQVTYGEVIGVKVVPAGLAVDAPALVVSDGSWRSSLAAGDGWTGAGFEDAGWAPVQVLGAMGGKKDFLQWNADAGLYAWPGYSGVSSALRTFRLPVAAVMGDGLRRSGGGFSAAEGAVVTLDFGREVSGRVHLVSGTRRTVAVETSYGESAEEADGHAYLGARVVTVPAGKEAFGPKSAFRYVRLRFAEASAWKAIDVEGIVYPVTYRGAFASSDARLNRIWETGAYTARLCMQDGIWDAPKRDRGRWMGDLDVTGRVIESVFGEKALMEETMTEVAGDEPVTRDVNTIAGYSALWITGQAEFYRHVGDVGYLREMKGRLVELLGVMDKELDANGLFVNPEKHKVFVDWSDGFSADGPEARAATQMEFALAYREAAFLLGELGDAERAAEYKAKAERMRAAAQTHLLDAAKGTFGGRWQTNAMAVVAGVATPEEDAAIWSEVLSRVKDTMAGPMAPKTIVTPYYGYYVLRAMAKTGHRAEALDWMRQYWGGMLEEGATSFWEAYDPRWPKKDFHAALEADGKKGYSVSLAHGWASGPTAWLMEEILGIEPVAAGFGRVTIRPDLAGLEWAKGAEPTPRGLIRVSATKDVVEVEIPSGTEATVSLPFVGQVLENGRPVATTADERGHRSSLTLHRAGTFRYSVKPEGLR